MAGTFINSRFSFQHPCSGEDPPGDRLRAAQRLVGNHKAVVRFAARGCGAEGRRPVAAPLSDPSATPGEDYLDAVDTSEGLCIAMYSSRLIMLLVKSNSCT